MQPLAVAAPKRIAMLPNVPTFAEAGMPEFEYDAWFGVMAPASTPIAIRTKVSQDVATILRIAAGQRENHFIQQESQGVVTVVNAPQEFDALIRLDTERFGKMLREAGVAAN